MSSKKFRQLGDSLPVAHVVMFDRPRPNGMLLQAALLAGRQVQVDVGLLSRVGPRVDLQTAALRWEFMSGSHGQELGQLADLASDWLFTRVAKIRSLQNS